MSTTFSMQKKSKEVSIIIVPIIYLEIQNTTWVVQKRQLIAWNNFKRFGWMEHYHNGSILLPSPPLPPPLHPYIFKLGTRV